MLTWLSHCSTFMLFPCNTPCMFLQRQLQVNPTSAPYTKQDHMSVQVSLPRTPAYVAHQMISDDNTVPASLRLGKPSYLCDPRWRVSAQAALGRGGCTIHAELEFQAFAAPTMAEPTSSLVEKASLAGVTGAGGFVE